MAEDWLSELVSNGWAALPRGVLGPGLAELLLRLGVTRMIRRALLRPTSHDLAPPNTLSSRHGLGAFPLHTDSADLDDPPRYVLLTTKLPRQAATLVLRDEFLRERLPAGDEALFRVAGRRRCHYARFRLRTAAGDMIRYNAATHTAVNSAAAEVEEIVRSSAAAAHRIDWTRNRMAVIDNWTCMHGREAIGATGGGRMHRLHIWTHR